MRAPPPSLEQFLDRLTREARAGDRLPPIREIMRQFGVSQGLVQRALQALKAQGLIDSHVGRGTFFRADAAGAADAAAPRRPLPGSARTVLLLRRSINIARGRVLIDGLQRLLAAAGHSVLEVAYTDPQHALAVLRSLPRFDACVIQSTYRTLPLEMLAALKEKCSMVAVDGLALIGTDVEAVGMEWGEPLACAVELLRQRGHQHIAFASTSQALLAVQLGHRRFEHLRRTTPGLELEAISVPLLPDDDYTGRLVEQLAASLDGTGRLPFTALVVWGIEDGERFRSLLSGIGVDVPAVLSVVLLGRTDLAVEHAGFFDVAGCSVADQIEHLHQAIQARWANPSAPYGVRLIPTTTRPGASIAAPATGKGPAARLLRSGRRA